MRGRWHIHRVLSVDTSAKPDRARKLKAAWAEVALLPGNQLTLPLEPHGETGDEEAAQRKTSGRSRWGWLLRHVFRALPRRLSPKRSRGLQLTF